MTTTTAAARRCECAQTHEWCKANECPDLVALTASQSAQRAPIAPELMAAIRKVVAQNLINGVFTSLSESIKELETLANAAPVAAQPEQSALSDEALLGAFNTGDSVIDGLHEVVTLVIRNLWPKGEYEATVTLLRKLVDDQWALIVDLRATLAATPPQEPLLRQALQAFRDALKHGSWEICSLYAADGLAQKALAAPAAQQVARNDILEEAAKTCWNPTDDYRSAWDRGLGSYAGGMEAARQKCAEEIRALKSAAMQQDKPDQFKQDGEQA